MTHLSITAKEVIPSLDASSYPSLRGETTIVHVSSYLQTQVSTDGESICIPIFQQREAVRDIKRLCETIAPYEGGIFAPLKLPDKSGSNGCFIHVLHNDLNGPSHHSDAG